MRVPIKIPFQGHLTFALALAVGTLGGACGGVGEGDATKCSICGTYEDIRGAISDQNGNQGLVLQGWAIAAFERNTNVARVAEVDAAGLFTLSHVDMTQPQTLALLSPDYQLAGVLSMPNKSPATIRQYFTFTKKELPQLINKGPIISFQSLDGIKISKDLASDQNSDQVPDGSVSIGSKPVGLHLAPAQSDSAIDLDQDGTRNEQDPDIDGDGIINILDPDDNGNGQLDVFDPDANGDYFADNTPGQSDTDPFFSIGVEYVSVQFALVPKEDGTGNETSLTFLTKVRNDVTPLVVQIRGAPSLLNNSYFFGRDAAGQPLQTAFNRLLSDDGLSNDGKAGDRIFGKRITLDSGKTPRPNEAIFFQLAFGKKDAPWYMEFPYVFPELKPSAISAQYDVNTKTVLLVGNPFAEYQTFQWITYVYDEAGQTIWTSQASAGDKRTMTIPEHIFDPGAKYKFALSAQVLDKIQGHPAYAVFTKKYDIE